MNTARSEGSVSTYQGYLDTLHSLRAVFCTLAVFSLLSCDHWPHCWIETASDCGRIQISTSIVIWT